ncbi:hypothetical protein OEZ85_011605 [Tetradesmus obliquus]|uniref:Agenet domain-containing protein n=1 Tax=Tetradesmus obliquus TaxID=3088 RepID=A0ABY8TT62_TETOB|nr:hypothetical protein OEZ85_011605 [Tetradesmus obliquus]
MSLLQLLLKPANRNLLEVVSHLPKLGVGSKVTRKAWEPYGDSYWEVVAVKPRTEDGSAGKVYGVLTWRGQREQKPRLINGRAKRVWRWLPSQQQQQHHWFFRFATVPSLLLERHSSAGAHLKAS